MSITLRQPLTLAECQQIRVWRNAPDVAPILRTGYKTEADQATFYWRWIYFPWWRRLWFALRRQTRLHRYYAVMDDDIFCGVAGLTYIDGVQAEISLVLGPDFRGQGIGPLAVEATLDEARRLGLASVVGECYAAGNLKFWQAQAARIPPRWMATQTDGSWRWGWKL